MRHRIVDLDPEPEDLRRERAGRGQHGIGRNDAVALRGDERHAGVDEVLLRVEHVECRALADASLLAHAVERDLGGGDLRLGGIDLRLGGLELPPGLGHRRLHLVARGVEIEPTLAERLLGLADGRVFGAALIDRHRELGGDRGLQRLEHRERLGRAEVLLHVAHRGQGGGERALGDLDLLQRDVDVVHRGGDQRVLVAAAADRAVEGTRREPVDRRRGGKPRRWRHADHLQVLRLRGDVVGLRQRQLRPAAGESRLRLRDVGACDLAGREAVARLPQRHFQHVHVAALQLEDGRRLQQVHVGGGAAEQHVLLGRAQRFAGGEDLALGLAGAGRRLQAVEQRLGGGEPVGLHRDATHGLVVDCAAASRIVAAPGQLIQILLGQAGCPRHARAIAGERGRDVLIDGAGGGTLGIELGIILVGRHQRAIDGAGSGTAAHQVPAVAVAVAIARGLRQKRRRHETHGRGKRCNLRNPRNRPLASSPPQHAQIPPPAVPPLAGRAPPGLAKGQC